MMQIIRNPEIKKMMMLYMAFTFIVSLTAFVVFSPVVMYYILFVCFGALTLFLIHTKHRYEDISNLSYEIDKILHASERAYLVPNQEGELAILTNQIAKMTIRLQEQSEQLQKEKGILSDAIANISHQIRTPLTSIHMTIHRLMKDSLTGEQRNECVCEINSMLSRIEWLITALLKIARLESEIVVFDNKKVAVNELLEMSLAPLEIMMEVKEIHADIQVEQDAAFIGDLAWTNEAVSNILKNCIEHTSQGGALKIRAIENSLYTKITIADNGTGIPEKELPHLFERFYKGENSSAQNIGIGLALSRMIIKKENGTIKVQNVIPHGTEFSITFYKGAV